MKITEDMSNAEVVAELRRRENLPEFGTVGAVLQSKDADYMYREVLVKKWIGAKPTTCDLCGKPLKHQFVDGRTIRGPWGLMCAICHSKFGCGLGTGSGQRYDLETLEKIEG